MEQEMRELYEERRLLSAERIAEIAKEPEGDLPENVRDYFRAVASFISLAEDQYRFVREGGMKTADLEELRRRNHALYEDVLEGNYERSYANPTYACKCFGEDLGKVLCAVYAEIRSIAGFVHSDEIDELVIREELFLEVYSAFVCAQQEKGELPAASEIRDAFYWFVSDYADLSAEKAFGRYANPKASFGREQIMEADLSDPRYLYTYGEYITDNEEKLAAFMAGLPEETVDTMADTFTEGFRIGFEVTGKDLSKKNNVTVHFPIGFERMIRKAGANFEKLGLQMVTRRRAASVLYGRSIYARNVFGTAANRQYDFDHKDDKALYLDRNYITRTLESDEAACEAFKEALRGNAGPALVESFGEADFDPRSKKEACRLSDDQNKLQVELRSKSTEMMDRYMPEEESSFTIISFPVPDIMEALPEKTVECYEEFFREVIRINTLDYMKYRNIQKIMIDALDQAQYCEIKGCGVNETDMHVELFRLRDPEKETIFENCVADVNIPVGEVFTSPQLAGTNGTLHVSRVYLNGLEFRNLKLTFEDGKVTDYSCTNFEEEEKNLDYIRENLLFRHKTLPLGEFAIGTNTTAYTVARKYGVESKLPILIAEKTGPHFAVGDTCYSHAEDVVVYNPDGKEIVARENEISAQRKTNPAKAYFNCHTDITIPYEELGELTAVRADGSRIPILENGRFVLPGTEPLNVALDE
jgi:leucyl aminopeptidase (aminopeptidase T)